MRHSNHSNRNSQTKDFSGLLERLVFLPGALVLVYGCWLLIAS